MKKNKDYCARYGAGCVEAVDVCELYITLNIDPERIYLCKSCKHRRKEKHGQKGKDKKKR